MKQTLPVPCGFQYWEYAYRRPIICPVPVPYEIPKELEWYCAVTGYRPTIRPTNDTEDVIDISVDLADDLSNEQFVKITLYANEYTRAKVNCILERNFYINTIAHNTRNYNNMLRYQRSVLVKEMLEGEKHV